MSSVDIGLCEANHVSVLWVLHSYPLGESELRKYCFFNLYLDLKKKKQPIFITRVSLSRLKSPRLSVQTFIILGYFYPFGFGQMDSLLCSGSREFDCIFLHGSLQRLHPSSAWPTPAGCLLV